jgi:iron complex outermembrane receptor protein
MKKLMSFGLLLMAMISVHAQYTVKGRVIEKNVALPVSNATIKFNDRTTTLSDENGYFKLKTNVKTGIKAEISAIGFLDWAGALPTDSAFFTVSLERSSSLMQPVEILAVRASEVSPFTKTTISARTIEKMNLGQDIPFLLNQTPSTVINSDAGNGVGYTGIRIRGTDATRINMTINGIPYNDAESQGVFFVNLPDLASSLNSLQIQRGVGTSANGAGAFGATMNLLTNEVNEKAYAELNNSAGSFSTFKNTLKAGTGLLNDHFTFDARLSRISSDGFVDRASSDLQSFFVSGAYLSNSSSLRFNVFSGKEKTYQSWYGIPESMLKTNRTFNSAGTERPGEPYDNETDNYRQTHYQLFYNKALSAAWKLNLAAFYTRGKGYYEQYKADEYYSDYGIPDFITGNDTLRSTDLIRQLWLDNHFFGNTFSLQYRKHKTDLIIGGGWSNYKGNHYGNVIWSKAGFPDNFRWYDLDADKNDMNIYAKWQQKLSQHLSVFTDLQLRNVRYNIYGFRNNPDLTVKNDWLFFNPKLGLSYTKNDWTAYISFAVANKEPNRDDFEAGNEQQPVYETLHDLEVGFDKKGATVSWGATVFYMNYRNQLILTGQINDVGAYARTNIPESYRAGIELTGSWKPMDWFDFSGSIAYSQNKIGNFTAYYDDYDAGGQKTETLSNTDIAYSPDWVASASLNARPVKNLELSLLNKYVSRQFLDNTGRTSRSLDPFFIQDLRASYRIKPRFMKEILIITQVNNLFNVMYEPNGYSFSYYYGGNHVTENFYFPMAGINFMAGLNLRF